MAFYDKIQKRIYTLPETSAVPKTLADEAKTVSRATGGCFKAGEIQSGLKQEAKAANKAVRRQSPGLKGKRKRNWKRPGLRGIKGI